MAKLDNSRPIRIGIIAGEASGDVLGAGLVKKMMAEYPNISFEGIAGPKMVAAGCKCIEPMETIAAGGLTEIIGRLWPILSARRRIKKYFLDNPPDLFIGIDAPDFNLNVEKTLKKHGVPTVHYVSPTVWAWRQGRIKGIAKAVDLMLTIFPFEQDIYERHNIPVCFVGHPIANELPYQPNKDAARAALGISQDKVVLAMLPGSRQLEVKNLAETFLRAGQLCKASVANLEVIIPAVDAKRRQQFEAIYQSLQSELGYPIKVVDGQARQAMAAADVVLLASGTATLECMLSKRPMVVAYKLSKLTHWILRKMVKVPYVSQPNLLAGEAIVPEFIQDDATPESLSRAVLERLPDSEQSTSPLMDKFLEIHKSLALNANEKASQAIVKLLNHKRT